MHKNRTITGQTPETSWAAQLEKGGQCSSLWKIERPASCSQVPVTTVSIPRCNPDFLRYQALNVFIRARTDRGKQKRRLENNNEEVENMLINFKTKTWRMGYRNEIGGSFDIRETAENS